MKLHTLNPSNCIFCDFRATYDELPVCRHCLSKLQKVLERKCKNCSKTPDECSCNKAQNIRFLFFFECLSSRIIVYWLKTSFEQRKMDFFVELMIRNSDIDPNTFDGVTYVPRWKRNIKIYGYDQAEQMARSVSRIFGIPLVHALKRVGKGNQKLLSFRMRKTRAKDMFALRHKPDEKFKKLLIVDDIITTGATITACAEILRDGFAKQVIPIVLAKTNHSKI